MGKKRRYRKFPHKFGRKCALKYGLNKEGKTLAEEVSSTPAPVIMAAPEPIVEEPVEKPPKKKAAPKKSATTTRKTTRKRTTKAKTTT